jgi:hypothetical protein
MYLSTVGARSYPYFRSRMGHALLCPFLAFIPISKDLLPERDRHAADSET